MGAKDAKEIAIRIFSVCDFFILLASLAVYFDLAEFLREAVHVAM